MKASRIIYTLLFLVLLTLLANFGLLNLSKLSVGTANLWVFIGSLLVPDFSVLPTILWALLETLQMAYAGTLLGVVMALPLSILASDLLFGTKITAPVRLLLSLVRTVPSLLWALIFLIAFGLGPAAGALGVAFYTLGYLGKLYYEAFQSVDQDVLEAVKGITKSSLHIARYAVIPESSNYILSQLLFMFEYNVRASAIMGFVGAGGIGFYMLNYVQALQYDRLVTALLATLALVLLVEAVSNRIRRSFIPREKAA